MLCHHFAVSDYLKPNFVYRQRTCCILLIEIKMHVGHFDILKIHVTPNVTYSMRPYTLGGVARYVIILLSVIILQPHFVYKQRTCCISLIEIMMHIGP